jgi:hypothetical protein
MKRAALSGDSLANRWDVQDVVDSCERGLARGTAALDNEQSPSGIDALDEVALHPLLAAALAANGWGVAREQPLPWSAAGAGSPRVDGVNGIVEVKRLPSHAQRERCDLVLMPSPQHVLLDWVRESRERAKFQGSLFESMPMPPPLPDRGLCVSAADACWLEVKVVAQHAFVDGVPRPNGAWGSQLVASLTSDLAKLSGQGLPHAGLLLVVFAEGPEVISHDLPIALHRALDKGAAFRSPVHATRRDANSPSGFAITDRIGNAWCECVLIPAV